MAASLHACWTHRSPGRRRRLQTAPHHRGEGATDSETGTLRMLVGGDPDVVARCGPIFEVLGDPERVVYCGPSGAGQVVKGVNQLAMGLGAAA